MPRDCTKAAGNDVGASASIHRAPWAACPPVSLAPDDCTGSKLPVAPEGQDLGSTYASFFAPPTVSVTGLPSNVSFDLNSKPFGTALYSNGPCPYGSRWSFSV